VLNERNAKALQARGFDLDLLQSYGVSDSERGGFDIQIPYVEGDRVVNYKYRNVVKSDKRNNFSQIEGSKPTLWNGNVLSEAALQGKPLFITEGEFDALSLIQAGFLRVVSVPNGAPADSGGAWAERYRFIHEIAGLAGINEIVLCADADIPGVNLREDLALILGRSRCKWVRYPKGCKDLNDALQRYGERGVVASVGTAEWLAVPGVFDWDQLPAEPYVPAHDLGVPGLEKHYRAREGDLCVITGIPGRGKSNLVLSLAAHMASAHKWPVALASFEMRPRGYIGPVLKTWHGRQRYWHQTEEELAAADAWLQEYFVFIRPPEEENATLEWMVDAMHAAVVRRGVKLVIIDPWNELEHMRDAKETLTEYTGRSIQRLKKFAAQHRVHLIIVAHPAKLRRDRGGEYPIPSLYDISDSAHWYNKPDVGVVVHRDADGNALIRVDKSRYHHEIGEPGDIVVKYNGNTARYEPLHQQNYTPDPRIPD
jgi:twinkle protein